MTNETILLINPDRRAMALLQIQKRLELELKTGLKFSSGSTISAARNWGYTGPNRKQACLDWAKAERGIA